MIFVNNSVIQSVRVLPRGVREVSIELVVRDEAEGRRAGRERRARHARRPDAVHPPPVDRVARRLDDDLVLIRARAAVAPGREWLANGFLAYVLRERAPEGPIVHGPVIIEIDDLAQRRFARATSGAERG